MKNPLFKSTTNISASNHPTILVVDDSPSIQAAVFAFLGSSYTLVQAYNGHEALEELQKSAPDLVLLDVEMPGMTGYEFCSQIKKEPGFVDIPVIFLTGRVSDADQEAAFKAGAADFIAKPINATILHARVKTHIQNKLAVNLLRDRNMHLNAEVKIKTREIGFAQEVTILALASLAETRDNETGNHIRRTQRYILALAERLRKRPAFSKELTPQNITLIYKSAPLHDIGKVGIPDRILLKPGPLDDDEFAIMKTHAVLGANAIEQAEIELGRTAPFLMYAKQIAHRHHEKWDGSGYPDGLEGEDIPVSARLMALADVYDALISKRVYKAAMSHEEAARIIIEGRGKHFDPAVVDAFVEIQEKFRQIADEFKDEAVEHDLDNAGQSVRRGVLIVDDNQELRTLFRLSLEHEYAIDEAANADEAMTKILSEPPEAVVLDIMLPGKMDGYELCQYLKKSPLLKDIHVVMVTGKNDKADQDHGFSVGADAYFMKPLSPAALLKHLKMSLSA